MFDWLHRKPAKPEWTISLHKAAATSNERAAAWTLFAGTKTMVRDDTYKDIRPERQGRRSAFDEELFARDAMAEFWSVQTPDVRATDPYLSLLVDLWQAGFLAEYVWTFCRQHDWVAPADLKMAALESWLQAHGIENHEPQTLSAIARA